jgi:3-hydroxy-3-methylglutaryl CoA synthase
LDAACAAGTKTTANTATHRTNKCSERTLCICADAYRAAIAQAFNLTAAHVPQRPPRLVQSANSARRQLPP